MMMPLTQWLLLLLTSLVGIIGLFIASGAGGGTAYGIGLLVFAAAVVYAFFLLKRHFDCIDAERH
jgi:hypothetical protein